MNAGLKSRQFCSVCKEWLEMEVVPTSDGDDDDGVIWYRCPQCQGFLPKLKNAPDAVEETPAPEKAAAVEETVDDSAMEFDSPSAMMEAEEALAENLANVHDGTSVGILAESDELPELDDVAKLADLVDLEDKPTGKPVEEAEPIHEYAAMLADVDPSSPTPYRPWGTYEVGQCVHHLAWDDCGVVVAKETLPGNRNIIKVYFEASGVVRLIENAPR